MEVTARLALLLGLALVVASTRPALAQPGATPATVADDPSLALREANLAATAGDWSRVSAYVEPLLTRQLDRADLAEAHRLAGIAALYAQPPQEALAEDHFLAYLRIDLDGHLDPSLYPPNIITFFANVRSKHAAELRARRPKAKRSWIPSLLPPWGQFNNGDRTKGVVVSVLLGTFLAANVTSYLVLRSWCFKQSRDGHESVGCDATTDRNASATTLRSINITAGVGLIVTYVWGVYDGVRGYRRSRREGSLAPYATSTNTGATFGVRMNF
jgi:hypothetical protein